MILSTRVFDIDPVTNISILPWLYQDSDNGQYTRAVQTEVKYKQNVFMTISHARVETFMIFFEFS